MRLTSANKLFTYFTYLTEKCFSSWMTVEEGVIIWSYSKKDLDLMSGNLSSLTELLIIGMYCHSVVLIVILLTLLKKYIAHDLDWEL